MAEPVADGLAAARLEVVRLAREAYSPSDDAPVTAFNAAVGGIVSSAVIGADGELIPDSGDVPDALFYWYYSHEDPVLGRVWWFALTVGESYDELLEGRDDWPPDHIARGIHQAGLVLEDPTVWFLQRRAFDHRPADRLPGWWIDKLRSVGAWDEEKQELALDAKGNPLHGPQLILDSSPGE